jgi:hypothetical protein
LTWDWTRTSAVTVHQLVTCIMAQSHLKVMEIPFQLSSLHLLSDNICGYLNIFYIKQKECRKMMHETAVETHFFFILFIHMFLMTACLARQHIRSFLWIWTQNSYNNVTTLSNVKFCVHVNHIEQFGPSAINSRFPTSYIDGTISQVCIWHISRYL